MVRKVVSYRCDICDSMFQDTEDTPALAMQAQCCEALGVPERHYDVGTQLHKPDGLVLHIYVAKQRIARAGQQHVSLYMVDEEWTGDAVRRGYSTGRVVTEADIDRWVAVPGYRFGDPTPSPVVPMNGTVLTPWRDGP